MNELNMTTLQALFDVLRSTQSHSSPDTARKVFVTGVAQTMGATSASWVEIDIRTRKVMPVIGPKPPPRRLTVTPPVIEGARQVVLLATGAGKAEALAQSLGLQEQVRFLGNVPDLPQRLAQTPVRKRAS